MTLSIKQVAPLVPIWDLLNDFGMDVGLVTNFPGEGLVFTVKHGDAKTTDYTCANMHEVILKASEAHLRLIIESDMPDEEHIEDEDGEIARMRYEENRAAEYAMREDMQEPPDWLEALYED